MAAPFETVLGLYFTEAEHDVWEEISKDLLSFSFDDSETNTADSVIMTLKDEKGKWAKRWSPESGEMVRATIKKKVSGKVVAKLDCGRFYVDSMKCAGSPRTFEMSAVSLPLNKPIRKRIKFKTWEKTDLKSIAQTIAKEADVKLLWDSDVNPDYDRIDQKKESDLKLLSRLCEEAGLALKVTDNQLVVYDQHFYEGKPAVKTITLGQSNLLSWNFETNQSEIFKSCTVSYRDPKKKKKGKAGGYKKKGTAAQTKKESNPTIVTYTAYDPEADENGQEYYLKTRCRSIDEAKRKATAMLRKLNRRGVVGDLSMVGDVDMVAGIVIAVKGFGIFDGNFIVVSASHSIGSSGYTTSVNLRRVSKEY